MPKSIGRPGGAKLSICDVCDHRQHEDKACLSMGCDCEAGGATRRKPIGGSGVHAQCYVCGQYVYLQAVVEGKERLQAHTTANGCTNTDPYPSGLTMNDSIVELLTEGVSLTSMADRRTMSLLSGRI